MKGTKHNLYNYFIPANYMQNEAVFRKARIFVNTVLITFVFALIYTGESSFFKMPHIAVQIAVYSVLFLSLLFLFRNGVPLIVCGNLFTFLFYTSNVYEIYYNNGIYSGTFPWLAMVPVTAILISSIRSAFIWLIIAVVTAIVIGVMQERGYQFQWEIDRRYWYTLLYTSHAGLILIFFTVSYVMEKAYTRSLNTLGEKNKVIEAEKKRSDELLLNILPEEVMNELKQTGKTTARNYDLVTVMFADFKDFTLISGNLTPEDLVSAIDHYFEKFDTIIADHDVEKIKTIGDAYLCAAGLPEPNTRNPVEMVDVAFKFLHAVELLKEERSSAGKISFDIRIGIHSGPLIAGVVGIRKFAYDIWGDAVNTAARMQQNGDEGRINISGTTYELIKHRFHCTHRGRIEAKNKGLVDMYFVEGRR